LIIEVHHRPEEALCDAEQALTPDMFIDIMGRLRALKSFLDPNVAKVEDAADPRRPRAQL